MAIYIGTTKIKDLYVGTSKVKEIYLGTNKVYSSEDIIWSGSATGTVTSSSVAFGPTISQVNGAVYKLTGNYEVTNGTNVKIDVRDYLQSGTFINIASANTGNTGTFNKTITSTQTRNRKLFQARYNNGAYTIKLTNVKLVRVA